MCCEPLAVDPREDLQRGDELCVVGGQCWILLEVRKEDAGRLAIGQQMLFSTVGLQDEVESKVTWISTEVDEKTRTVQVRAEVLNPQVREGATGYDGQRLLRANSFGSGRLRVHQFALDLHRADGIGLCECHASRGGKHAHRDQKLMRL